MENQEVILHNRFIEYANGSMEKISADDTPKVKQLRQDAINRFIAKGFPSK